MGETISELGTGLTYIALMSRFAELTGQPAEWVWIIALRTLPFVVFGLGFGQWSDTRYRKHLLSLAHLGRLCGCLALAFCDQLWLFFALVLSNALFDALHIPTYRATVATLLDKEDLLSANSMQESARSIATIAGVGLSGILVELIGSKGCFIVDAFSYLIAATNLMFLKHSFLNKETQEQEVSSSSPGRFNWDDGIKTLSQPIIRYPVFLSLLLELLVAFEMPMFFPLCVEKGWNGATATGYCYASACMGSLLTSCWLMKLRKSPIHSSLSVSWVLLADSLILLAVAWTTTFRVGLIFSFGFGITETLFRTYSTTAIQERLPKDLVGRTFAGLDAIKEPLKLISIIGSGILLQRITATQGLYSAASAEVAIAISGLLYFILRLNKLKAGN